LNVSTFIFRFKNKNRYKEAHPIDTISAMDTSLNFVALLETNPITRLKGDYNNRFINRVKETFTEKQQQLFVASLYCFLNYHPTNDFVIDLDNIWQWLGFQQKYHAKYLLEKYYKEGVDFLIPNIQDKTKEGRGGQNRQSFLLNIETFKMLCIKANTKKAHEIHKYFIKLEELLQTIVLEETNELRLQLEQANEKMALMEMSRKVPIIYVYNTDMLVKEHTLLKIGITQCIAERIIPYKTISPRGQVVFQKEIDDGINLKTFERSIHDKLAPFRVNSEVFCMNAEEAIACILAEYNMYKIMKNTNISERSEQIKQLHYFMENGHELVTKVPTHDEGTQTEFNEMIPATTPLLLDNQDMLERFDAFIQDHCIVRPDVQVSAKDIVGQYRLHCQEAKKEITQGFTDYLKRRFVYGRLTEQTKDQVVLGFFGVVLKPIVYQKGPVTSDEETAVFEKCVFTPAGTMLFADIWEAYVDWKRVMKKPVDEAQDPKKLKQYLKSSPYTLFDTVWSSGGSGQGFYGIKLKRDVKHHRTSSTGCAIVKKNTDGMVLCEYDTIAKAAAEESMCPAKMSRSVKNRITFGTGDFLYYYEKKPRS